MKSQIIRLTTVIGAAVLAASAAQAQSFGDGFEAYAAGSDITGQGGWAQWDNNAIVDNSVSTLFAHTGSKSLATELHADKIHTFTGFTSGRWNWSVWTYVPSSGTTLPQWAVFLSTYNPGGPYFWVAQCQLDPALGQIAADLGPNSVCGGTPTNQFGITAPLTTGVWAEIRIDIDLTADRAQFWYAGQPVGQVYQYTDGISAGFGLAQIDTIDLYANDNTVAGDRVYWDDVSITANTSPQALECLGVASVYCTAGTSLSGCVPSISGVGVPSASAGSGFSINLANGEGNKQGILFYGRMGQISSPWAPTSSSFLCVKAPTQRTPLQPASGAAGTCTGAFSIDWNTFMATNPLAVGNPRSVGESFDAQYWYRDNTAAVKSTSLSDGLHFALAP